MQYDEALTFGAAGSVRKVTTAGFDFGESAPYSWTIAQSCEIDVPLPMPRQEVAFQIDAAPFTSGERVTGQQLVVYLNGLFLGMHTFRSREAKMFPVFRTAISPRSTRIALVIPTAASPKQLGLSSDVRELGFAVYSILFKTR